jgi:tetratricopeptide (TPR) repeat protein
MTQSGTSKAESLYIEGASCWNEGRREEAIVLVDAALKEKPDYPEALCMGGYILGQSGKRDAALAFYRQALKIASDLAVAWSNSGKLLFELQRYDEALSAFERAIDCVPQDALSWSDKAGALRQLGRLTESIAAADEAARLKPDHAEAHLNRGTALLKLDRVAEALEAYRRAEACKPNYADAICGAALALRALDRLDEAAGEFDRAIQLGSWDALSGKGCMQLMAGDFENGWEGYEARWIAGQTLAEKLGAALPTWTGELTPGLRVLVLNDHGLGDTIQFFRYVQQMADAGLNVTFLAPAKVHRLLAGHVDVRLTEAIKQEQFDAQIALSSLPRAFRTRLETIPANVPYLRAEPNLQAKWADLLAGGGFKIGVVWQGNPNPEADCARSMPLAAFAPIAAVPGVRLVSLQKGFGTEQLAKLPEGMRVETPARDFDDGADAFIDTAALVASLDLVITCDTSIAHLAGALGRPVWVVLKTDSEWRWMRNRDDCPWYPTMKLYRQTRRGDWSDVFETMAATLPAKVAAPSTCVEVPVSIGELLDKIAILEIKQARMTDAEKIRNVTAELEALQGVAARAGLDRASLHTLERDLAEANVRLWEIEDQIRVLERRGDFGDAFVALARSVYLTNDRRAALKMNINRACKSRFVEEKSYATDAEGVSL